MSSDILIHQPDSEEHEHHGSLSVQQANDAVILTNEDRELAGSIVAELTKTIAIIEHEFNGTDQDPGPVALAYKAWKSGVALRDKALAGFVAAKNIWVNKSKKFEYDQERKRLAEAQKAEAAARQKAEDERQRAIQEAKRAGDREAAQALKEAPLVVTPAPPRTPEVTKAEGLRRSSPDWDFVITDVNKIPREYMIPDEKGIRAVVKRLGTKAGIPGISVHDRRSQG